MTLDNVIWIASCTNMNAGLACMQLVERGKLNLDDGDEIEKSIPELKDLWVLQKGGKLVPKNQKNHAEDGALTYWYVETALKMYVYHTD
jgi:hypothetical protein